MSERDLPRNSFSSSASACDLPKNTGRSASSRDSPRNSIAYSASPHSSPRNSVARSARAKNGFVFPLPAGISPRNSIVNTIIPLGWLPDDSSKSKNAAPPRIIITTASSNQLSAPNSSDEDEISSLNPDLRPLDSSDVRTELYTSKMSLQGDDGENTKDDDKKSEASNMLYEYVGETIPVDPVEELAPDGGWGWLVLIGNVFMACVLLSLAPCFGVLFTEVMRDNGVSSTNSAWIFNIHMFVWNITSILSGPLVRHFGWRVVGCTSSLLLSVSFMLLSLSKSPAYILCIFGILVGGLGGISAMTCYLILPSYFNKRRGMATSLFSAGIPIGYIIMPLLIRYLQDQYGFYGAILIHGAILLNTCVACALFRPLIPPRKGKLVDDKSNGDKLPKETSPSVEAETQTISFCELCRDVFSHTLINLKGMKHMPLLLTTSSVAFFLTGTLNYVSLLPFALRAQGYSPDEASYAISMTGVGNIFIRLFVSCIADAKWVNRKYVYLLGLVITTSCTYATPLMIEQYHLLLGVFAMWGVGLAASSSMFLVLLIDVVGLSQYESATTVVVFLLAIISICAGPAFGYVRDYTQSYSACLSTVGTVQLIAALLWLLLPKAQKWQDSQVRRESAKFVRRHSTTPPAATSSQPATLRRHSSISSVELALHR